MVFFDRSWYNRAVIEPVMGYCSDKEYEEFMSSVNDFEKDLIQKDNVIVVKLWLSISKSRQKLRFEYRKTNPLKYWKYSDNDKNVLDKWEDFTHYINKMLKNTSTLLSPWNIIDANDKRLSKINSLKIVLNKIDYDFKNINILKNDDNNL